MAPTSPAADPRIHEHLWAPYVQDVELACASWTPLEDTALVLAHWAREVVFGTCGPSFVVPPGLPIWMGRGDGGHGRGFPQIDDRAEFAYLIPPDGEDWPVFKQAQATCVVLAAAREDLAEFRGALSPHAWDEAVACRYNAKLENVQWAIRNGRDPNRVTTPGPLALTDPATGRKVGDYGRDVLALRDGLRALFPTRFPAVLVTSQETPC